MGREQSTLETPRGITVRKYASGKQSLIVSFQYRGVECRETLKNIEPTKANIKYAVGVKAEIEKKITQGTFSYADYFPKSKRAKLFGHVNSAVTVKTLLDDYLKVAERTLKASTANDYRKSIKGQLTPAFGTIRIGDLTPATIRDWVVSKQVTTKRIRNIFAPLRAVLEQAIVDGLIQKNPLDQVIVKKLVSRETATTDYEVDPFSEQEIAAILEHADGQGRNLVQFAFFTGLRTNELIALEWRDIDWVHSLIHVQRGQVMKKVDAPKTNAGVRDVLMLEPARQALLSQKAYTLLHASGRVFHNPRTGKPWETDAQIRKTLWAHVLKRAGVRYRNPYQTRHTYASMLLSKGENLWWLVTQMGHVNIEMIMRNYGRWIPDSSRTGYQPVNKWTVPGEAEPINKGKTGV